MCEQGGVRDCVCRGLIVMYCMCALYRPPRRPVVKRWRRQRGVQADLSHVYALFERCCESFMIPVHGERT